MVSYREGPNTGLTRRWLALWTTKQKTTGLSHPLTQRTLVNVSGIFREQNQTVEERLRKSAEMEKPKLQDEGRNCRKDLSSPTVKDKQWKAPRRYEHNHGSVKVEGERLAPSHLGAEGKLNSWDHRAISFHRSQLPGSIRALSWARGERGSIHRHAAQACTWRATQTLRTTGPGRGWFRATDEDGRKAFVCF